MKKQNSIREILTNKSGASLIFVLGVMAFLFAIGASALAAASANTGFILNQREHNQIIILDDSIHRNILHALQRPPAGSEDEEDLLSTQIAMAVYKANDSELNDAMGMGPFLPGGLSNIQLDIGGVNIESGNVRMERVLLSFPQQEVHIRDAIPAIYRIDYDYDPVTGISTPRPPVLVSPRIPRTATINATMVVTVDITVGSGAEARIITSRAFYEYTGGRLSDDPNGTHSGAETATPVIPVPEMVFDTSLPGNTAYGEWRLVRYERAHF